MREVIKFDTGNLRFAFRVVGVAIDDDRVLLEKVDGQDFWFLPGGRGELLEMSKETLKREMLEELNTKVKVGRLAWVVENFFTTYDVRARAEMSYHELGFYFLMELPKNSPLRKLDDFPGEDDGYKLTWKWHSVDNLANLQLHPAFLRKGLRHIPDSTEHIVQRDK